MTLSAGTHCFISIVAILGTSDLFTLNTPPRTAWASLPVAAALLTVLFISANPANASIYAPATALCLLLAISIASVVYTAQHPQKEDDARRTLHYVIQGGLILTTGVGLWRLST